MNRVCKVYKVHKVHKVHRVLRTVFNGSISCRGQSAPQGSMDFIDLMDFTDLIDSNRQPAQLTI